MPLPIQEIESTEVFDAYDTVRGPFCARKSGRPDLVVMRSSDLDHGEDSQPSDEMIGAIQNGLDALDRGEHVSAREAIASVRSKYGL